MRFSVFLDGRYGFSVSEENLLKLGLRNGQDIDEQALASIAVDEENRKALDSVFRLLAVRNRSRKELTTRLKLKKLSKSSIDAALGRIKEIGYLDDAKYARERINYLRRSGKGPAYIRMDLRKAGIDEETISELLTATPESRAEEVEQIKNIALSRLKRMSKTDPLTASRKLTGFLARRGFDIETIKDGLKAAKMEIEEQQE